MSFSKHTFGSLFAGVGGFDMGFEQAGWDCKFQVEWDKHCQSILNRHWPSVPKWGDVSTVSGHELPAVDCIIFGSPCQDLSVAGKRAGLDGERSGLFHEAMRIIKEMRDATNGTFPRWIVWENVAGAFSSNKGADFGVILDEMAAAGAVAIEWALLDAQHFGVPQRRRRVFVVACFDPATADRCPDPLLPVSESLPGDSKKGRKKGKTTSRTLTEGVRGNDAIVNAICAETYHHGSITNQDLSSGHMVVEGSTWWDGGDIAEAITTTSNLQRMPDKKRLQVVIESTVIGTLAARDHKGVGNQYVDEGKVIVEPFVKSRRPQSSTDDETWVEGEVAPTLNAFDVGDTRATTAIVGSLTARDGKGLNHEGARDGKAIIEPVMAVRRITPIECERLMGWPDDHTKWTADGKEQSDTHRYKQCGNGVATPVARWIAQHMIAVDTATDTATNPDAQ